MCIKARRRPLRASEVVPTERQRLEIELQACALFMAGELTNGSFGLRFNVNRLPERFRIAPSYGQILRLMAALADRIDAIDGDEVDHRLCPLCGGDRCELFADGDDGEFIAWTCDTCHNRADRAAELTTKRTPSAH